MTSFIPYGRQTVTEADIAAVLEILRGPFLTQGPTVPAFEQAIAEHVGARYGVAVNSATSALHLACLALGLGRGDRLWTTPITFVASANCGLYCGADVDFVDIDPHTGLMSVESLEKKLHQAARENSLPKVLVPVHLCGTSCAMKPISALARHYGVSIIEDASHAIGGRYCGEQVGGCQHSAISIFSFHPVKIITTGEGGLATTNDSVLAQDMRDRRSHGIVREEARFEGAPTGPWCYEQQTLGFNYRMSDLQAALGISQLKRLEVVVRERQRLMGWYRMALKGLPLRLLEVPENVDSAQHLAIIRLDNKSPEYHHRIFSGLRAAGIGVQLHYTPVHLQPHYKRLGFKHGDFPEAESYATNSITVPIYPGLAEEEQQRVVETLSTLLRT